jgi:homoserine O-succinyltransferase
MRNDEIERRQDIRILARAPESGISIAECRDGLEFYLMGHQEYAIDTLDNEYHRDLSRGLPIRPPVNYYKNDDPTQPIVDTWQKNGKRVYANWVKHYVMKNENTPFVAG